MSLPAPPSIFASDDPMAVPQDPTDQDAMLAAWMDLMLVISQKQLELSMLIQRLAPDRDNEKVYRSHRSLGDDDADGVMPRSMNAIAPRRTDTRRITELNAELAALFLRVNALKLKWTMRGGRPV